MVFCGYESWQLYFETAEVGDGIPQELAGVGGTYYSSRLPQHGSFTLSIIKTSQKSQNWKGPPRILESNF